MTKDMHSVKLATISCQRLQEQFLKDVCRSYQENSTGTMHVQISFLDPQMKIDAFRMHAKTTIDMHCQLNPDASQTLVQVLIEDK